MNKAEKKRIIFVISIAFLLFTSIKAQQLPLYSQYLENKFLLNPAVAGSEGFTTYNLTARENWLGIKSAPRTYSFSLQTRLLKRQTNVGEGILGDRQLLKSRKGRVGLGGFVYNDKNADVSRTGMQLTYAYHIFLSGSQLSFGLSGSFYQFKINKEELEFADPGDPLAQNLDDALFAPDANLGMYYMGYNFYAGISAMQLFQTVLKVGNEALKDYRTLRNYYLIGGYKIRTNSDYRIEPSFLVKANEKQYFLHADLTCKVYYKDQYWGGLSYRTNDALIALAGVKVNQLYFGYAYDYSLSNIQKYSFGSHEIIVALKLGSSARRYRWKDRY